MITHVDTSREQLILVNILKIKAFYFWNKLHYKMYKFYMPLAAKCIYLL
jgi:hypothetical protein